MKTALSLAVLCVVFVLISSENCHRTSDCHITTCASGAHLGCVNSKCSCFVDHASCPNTCAAKSDCDACNCESLDAEHCVDQKCRCFHGHGRSVFE